MSETNKANKPRVATGGNDPRQIRTFFPAVATAITFGLLHTSPPMGSKDQAALPTTVDFGDITEWYQRHCDGSWEHEFGVRLETLDNPGWLLTVDLIHTDLQGRTMIAVREGIAPQDHPVSPRWIHCSVGDNQFRGACDPTQVARLFQIFHQFRCSQTPC